MAQGDMRAAGSMILDDLGVETTGSWSYRTWNWVRWAKNRPDMVYKSSSQPTR